VTTQRTRWSHDSCSLSANELAAKLNIPVNWVYVQIRQMRLLIDRQPTGALSVPKFPAVLDAVRELRNHTIGHLDLRINSLHQRGINMRNRSTASIGGTRGIRSVRNALGSVFAICASQWPDL